MNDTPKTLELSTHTPQPNGELPAQTFTEEKAQKKL